ncbi:hypothetical protein ABW21_db0202881 [Orbilia brochopaga]|nr:hypothetical protein ABW21_db0202881 [Drechslerella brochopaga]
MSTSTFRPIDSYGWRDAQLRAAFYSIVTEINSIYENCHKMLQYTPLRIAKCNNVKAEMTKVYEEVVDRRYIDVGPFERRYALESDRLEWVVIETADYHVRLAKLNVSVLKFKREARIRYQTRHPSVVQALADIKPAFTKIEEHLVSFKQQQDELSMALEGIAAKLDAEAGKRNGRH